MLSAFPLWVLSSWRSGCCRAGQGGRLSPRAKCGLHGFKWWGFNSLLERGLSGVCPRAESLQTGQTSCLPTPNLSALPRPSPWGFLSSRAGEVECETPLSSWSLLVWCPGLWHGSPADRGGRHKTMPWQSGAGPSPARVVVLPEQGRARCFAVGSECPLFLGSCL